jgi:hypothetical protein
MPGKAVRMIVVLAGLMIASASFGQNKAPEPDSKSARAAKDASKSQEVRFYYHSWQKGELKVCESYSGAPSVVVCESDDDVQWRNSFVNMIADNNREGLTEEQSYRKALDFASKRGKSFLASFSDDPWPKPQTGLKLSVWSCSKDKDAISCSLAGARP